jgi:parvulin-like peptidyl-prolyl isomerase
LAIKLGEEYVIMKQALAIILAVIAVTYFGCSKSSRNAEDPRFSDKRVVLQEGDHQLTLGEIQKHFSATKFDSVQQEFNLKKDLANQFLDRFLLLDGAREAGITAELDSAVIRRTLMENLYNKRILSKINVTDHDIDDFFARYGGEVEAGLISVYDSSLADSLYGLISKGGDFEQLARQFSKDRYTAGDGGNLGYIGYGRLNGKTQDAAFDMKPGEVSKPIRTRTDWEIVKVYDRIKTSRQDLDSNREKYRNMTNQYLQKTNVEKFVTEIRSQYHFKVNQDVLEMMIRKADAARSGGLKPLGLPNSAYLDSSLFTGAERQMKMAQFDGGGITVDDYLDLMRRFPPQRAPDLKDSMNIDRSLQDLAMPNILYNLAKKEEIDKSKEFIDGLEWIRGNNLVQKMREKIYSSQDSITYNDVVKYYNDHPDDFFMPDQVRVTAIATKDQSQAASLLDQIKKGASFQQLAMKYSIDKSSAINGGDLGFFTVARYTPIYKACEGLKRGDLGGPVEYNGSWWIFGVVDRIERSRKRLDLVKEDIYSLMGKDLRTNAYNDWIAKRKETAHYTMDLDLIKNNLFMGPLTQTGKETK